jgi:hypothetical protein
LIVQNIAAKKNRKFEWSVGTLVPSVLAVSLDNKISIFVIKIILKIDFLRLGVFYKVVLIDRIHHKCIEIAFSVDFILDNFPLKF